MKLGILGAGSLGTILGALLTKDGQDVELIDRNEEHVRILNEKGAAVTGKMNISVPVKAITPAEMSEMYDIIFYLVKATHDEEALKQACKYLKPDGMLLTMQNGIPEDRVAAVIGRKRTLGCAVGWGATWIEPGVSMLTSEPEKMTYDIGELDGADTERLLVLINILKSAGIPEKTNNLLGLRWTKLTANATFSAMSTIIGGTYGDVLNHKKAVICAAFIAREALAVIRGAGINPQLIQGFDIRYLDFNSKKQMDNILPVYNIIFEPHRTLKASMLQDIEKGHPCEIDAINGVISEWARKYDVLTPVNDKVVEIIKNIQAGRLQPGADNLEMIDIPELPEE